MAAQLEPLEFRSPIATIAYRDGSKVDLYFSPVWQRKLASLWRSIGESIDQSLVDAELLAFAEADISPAAVAQDASQQALLATLLPGVFPDFGPPISDLQQQLATVQDSVRQYPEIAELQVLVGAVQEVVRQFPEIAELQALVALMSREIPQALNTESSPIFGGLSLQIGNILGSFSHANSVARTWTFPDATDIVVLLTFAQTLTNKKIGDPVDPTKALAFSLVSATTGKTTTFFFNQTDNRTLTFPDATCALVYETAALVANELVIGGGGANVAPLGDLGTASKVLHGNAGGAPTWDDVDLTSEVEGTLPPANGGTGITYDRIAAQVALAGQTTVLGPNNFGGVVPPGTYRLNYYLEDTTADGAAGTIQLSVAFADDAGATTVTSAALALSALGRTSGLFEIRILSGNIVWQTLLTGAFGTSQYALYMTLERLS